MAENSNPESSLVSFDPLSLIPESKELAIDPVDTPTRNLRTLSEMLSQGIRSKTKILGGLLVVVRDLRSKGSDMSAIVKMLRAYNIRLSVLFERFTDEDYVTFLGGQSISRIF